MSGTAIGGRSLRSLITSNRNFRSALEEGFVPIGQTATRLLGGESFDADELLDVLEQEEQRKRQRSASGATLVHSTQDFDSDRWLDDLDEDHEILDDIDERRCIGARHQARRMRIRRTPRSFSGVWWPR